MQGAGDLRAAGAQAGVDLLPDVRVEQLRRRAEALAVERGQAGKLEGHQTALPGAVGPDRVELLDDGPGVGEAVDGALHAGGDLRIDRGVQTQPPAVGDAQARRVGGGGGMGEGAGQCQRLRVARVRPGQRVEHQRHVGDGAGHLADHRIAEHRLGEADGVGDDSGRGLHADHPDMGGGPAGGAAAVGAERQRRQARRHRAGRPAGGAAGGQRQVPGIPGRAVQEVGRHPLAGEFGAVGDAREDGARGAQPGHRHRVLRRHEALEQPRSLADRLAAHPDVVLHREGHAEQGQRLALRGALVGGPRLRPPGFRIEMNDGVQPRILRRDPLQKVVVEGGGADLAGSDLFGDPEGAHHAHGVSLAAVERSGVGAGGRGTTSAAAPASATAAAAR